MKFFYWFVFIVIGIAGGFLASSLAVLGLILLPFIFIFYKAISYFSQFWISDSRNIFEISISRVNDFEVVNYFSTNQNKIEEALWK